MNAFEAVWRRVRRRRDAEFERFVARAGTRCCANTRPSAPSRALRIAAGTAGPTTCATQRARRSRSWPATPRNRRPDPVPSVAAVPDRSPAGERVSGAAGHAGSSHRLRRRRRGRLGIPGRPRARHQRRRPARRVQHPRPGLGLAAVLTRQAARGGLRAVRADDSRLPAPRRRAAHRSRDGPVPAVLDSGRHGAGEGAYVRSRAVDLLAIVALESQRARAVIVGEDLGTVEERTRHDLAARRILSYRLVWFEKTPPATYPEQALSAITTHDLPTVAGLWTGADLEAQRRLKLAPNEAGRRRSATASRR